MSNLIHFWICLALNLGIFGEILAGQQISQTPTMAATQTNEQKSLRELKAELIQKLQKQITDLNSKQSLEAQEKIAKLKAVFELEKRSALFNKNTLKAGGLASLFAICSGAAIYQFYKKPLQAQNSNGKKLAAIYISIVSTGLILLLILGYFFSEKIALAVTGAETLDETKYAHVYQMAKELSKNANIFSPNLYATPDKSLNAFAAGRSPTHSSVIFTQGILDALAEDELCCILGHEMSHIRNYDVLWNTLILICSLPMYFATDLFTHIVDKYSPNSLNNDVTIPDVILFLTLKSIRFITKLSIEILKLSVSRSVEYRADREGCVLGENPAALARALAKLEKCNNEHIYSNAERNINKFLEFAFTVPAKSKDVALPANRSKLRSFIDWVDEFFATHPRTYKRIIAAEELDRIYRDKINKIVA